MITSPKFQAIYTLKEDQNPTFENALSDAIGTSHIQTYSNRSGSKFQIWKRSNLIFGRNRNRPLCWKDFEQNLSKAKDKLDFSDQNFWKMPLLSFIFIQSVNFGLFDQPKNHYFRPFFLLIIEFEIVQILLFYYMMLYFSFEGRVSQMG